MKKITSTLLSSITIITLLGCGGGGGSSDTNSGVSGEINLNGTWKRVEKYTLITPKEIENPNKPCIGLKAEATYTITNNVLISISGEEITFDAPTRNGTTSISCEIERGENTNVNEPAESIKWNSWICEEDNSLKDCEFNKKISNDKFVSTSKETKYNDNGKVLYEVVSETEFTRIK